MSATKTTFLKTGKEALEWMSEQGLSQAELARRFKVSKSLVEKIIAGQKACKRGASHNIAVFLGMKKGVAIATKQAIAKKEAHS